MPPDTVITLFPFLFLFVAPRCFCQLQQCYNLSGSIYTDLPCDPGANVSACCGEGYTCATNFYCLNNVGFRALGSCTDQTWQDPACPLPINIHNYEFNYTQFATNCTDGTFCPYPDNQTCCYNHQGHKLISYHYFDDAALPTAAAALSTFYAENGYQIATTTSSSSTILPTTSSSSPLPVFPSTSAPTFTYVVTSPSDRNSPSPLDTGAKTGIGIGVVVGTLAIAGMFLLLLRRVRRHHRDNTGHSRALGTIERAPPDPRQWKKPQLIGEDARKRMEAEGRRKANLPGEDARTEMGTADLRQMIIPELYG